MWGMQQAGIPSTIYPFPCEPKQNRVAVAPKLEEEAEQLENTL